MKRRSDKTFVCVLAGTVVLVGSAGYSRIGHAQENTEPMTPPVADPLLGEAEKQTTEPVQAPELRDEESVDASSATQDTEAASDDGLEEIVLPSQVFYDEEEAYLDDVDPNVLDTTPVQTTRGRQERLQQLFVIYMNAIADRQFDEADSLAKQIVELTIEMHGLDSNESAKALTNLAIAQHGMDDYESAILNYDAAIGIVERTEDRLSSELINPLRGLGAAQLASGRPDLAREAFDRAVHVSHVNSGPHNLEQVEILQALAETYLAAGEPKSSVDVQKRIYYLQARNIDNDSMDIIPALRTRADWQSRMQLYEQQRYTLRRIVNVIEENKGKDSLDLLEPLTELGNSFLYIAYNDDVYSQPVSVSSGEIYLKRAVRITEANKAASLKQSVDAKLELGDYYVLTNRPNRGHRIYRELWRLLEPDEESLALRDSLFGKPVMLQDMNAPTIYGASASAPIAANLPGFDTGNAKYEYTVSTRGITTNVRLVDANPPGLSDLYEVVGRQIRRVIHRPRLEDGLPVRTEKVQFTHSFLYRPSDLPDETSEAVPEESEAP